MQKLVGFSLRKGLVFLFLVLFWVSTSANAEEKGEGGYITMEDFTVNLVGLHQVIQVKLTLKPAVPTVAEKIKLYVPAIRHGIILLLSAKTPEQLQTQEGKKKLITETRNAANKALGLNSKEGVAEVLIESIIIQ
jgi:flagellar FliL protein